MNCTNTKLGPVDANIRSFSAPLQTTTLMESSVTSDQQPDGVSYSAPLRATTPTQCENSEQHPEGVSKSSRGVGAIPPQQSGGDERRPPDCRRYIPTLKGWQKRQAAFLSIGGLSLLLFAQVRVNYHNENFTLSDFDHFSATFEDNGVAFSGDGKPLKIELAASGTTVTGNNAEGHAIRQPNASYFLQDSTITGSAVLVMDSAAAQKASKKPSTETTNTKIQSETLKYSGTATDGRIEFPGAVVIDSSSKGTSQSKDNKTTTFDRTLHLTGAKGFITVLINAAGNNAIQTGEMDGPILYSGKTESTTDGKTDTTNFDGKADHMQLDFTKEPRTITLTGHVTLHSQGAVAAGDISADTVIITVDANLKPTKVDITGSPAQTTYHPEPPK